MILKHERLQHAAQICLLNESNITVPVLCFAIQGAWSVGRTRTSPRLSISRLGIVCSAKDSADDNGYCLWALLPAIILASQSNILKGRRHPARAVSGQLRVT